MSFQIEEIAIYGREEEPRSVKLRLGRLNIITGKSNRGKSALIQIIEYCLGRSTFMVPDGKIRDSVSWYGLLLRFNDGARAFVAKPRPFGGAETQRRVHLDKGPTADVPPLRSLNADVNDDYLEKWLGDRLAISPNMHVPDPSSTRNAVQATVKHTAFYLFQDQNVVANKEILFHRQNEQFIPQTIKDTLPYFLGAVREDRLRLTQELRDARRRLRLAEKDLHDAMAISAAGLTRGRALLSEAMQAGILPTGADGRTQDQIVELLRRTQLWLPGMPPAREGEQTATVRRALDDGRARLRVKTEQIEASEAFAREAEGYSVEASEQLWRLQSIGILKDNSADTCPLCDSKLAHTVPTATEINESLSELQANLTATTTERPRLREYIQALRSERQVLREEVEQRRVELESLMAEESAWEELRDANARAARVVGRVSLYLETLRLTDGESRLRSELSFADQEVKRLQRELDDDGVEARQESILRRISSRMTEWAKDLELEHRSHPYRLDLNRLTVVADKSDRPIPMFRMGGGQNYLGCHLIALLALHAQFAEGNRPVPRFIVLDQPSQVHFASPDVYQAMKGTTAATLAAQADMTAVRRMFRFLHDVCEAISEGFQIIVLEHANLAEDWFQQALVEEPWADDLALVPEHWSSLDSE